MRTVLEMLPNAGLYLKTETCKLNQLVVNYQGLIVGNNEVGIDQDKMTAVKNCGPLECTFYVRFFGAFANLYRGLSWRFPIWNDCKPC